MMRGSALRGSESRFKTCPIDRKRVMITPEAEREPDRLPTRRILLITAAAILLLSFLVYFHTLSPSLSSQSDSGELVSAAATLGICHPPGYPFYTLLGYLFSLLPLEGCDTAFRINLMSAVFSSLTAAMLFLLGFILYRNFITALCVSLLFAFSLEFWKLSLSAEVFSLHIFFVVLILYLLFRWREESLEDDKRPTTMYLFFLAYGLSLSHHHTILFLIPPCLYMILKEKMYRQLRDYKAFIACLLLFIAGLIPYIYLPLRSAAHPSISWEDAGTLKGFVRILTRAGYGTFSLASVSGETWSISIVLREAGQYLKLLAVQFGSWFFIALGLLGVFYEALRRRGQFYFFTFIFLIYGFVFLLMARFPQGEGYMAIMSRFFLPSYLAWAVFIGMALTCLSSQIKGRLLQVFRILIILMPLVPLVMNFPSADRRDNYTARDYGRNLLKGLDEKAVIIVLGDIHFGSAVYSQQIEKNRQDVTILVEGLLTSPWYREKKSRESPDLSFLATDTQQNDRKSIIISIIENEKGSRPVFINHPVEDPDIISECHGLAWRITTGTREPLDTGSLETLMNEKYIYTGRLNAEKLDYFSRELLKMYSCSFFFLASRQSEEGEKEKAISCLERAIAMDRENNQAMYLLGTLQIEENLLDKAEQTFITLNQRFKESREVYTNLAIIYARKGEHRKAKEALRNAQQYGGVKE
ncbi:MAG: DUF2723 domain-containing protein [Vulcanimicrobiota bacterium]